jgi:CRISPR-associated protein (TIGR02584 family)
MAPEAFVPTEIHVITTLEGAQRARLALLSADPGWFHRLRSDYGLAPIAFGEEQIHVLTDAQGQALKDIRTPADNLRCADLVTEQVRQFTADAACALHVSIAGGRKTMGFYLGYAMSLFGRPQDRLSHVLVSEPFESSWDFFYPSRQSRVIKTRDGELVDASLAELTLADIPFFSLRAELPQALLTGQVSFDQTVQAARAALAAPDLCLDLPARRIRAAGQSLPLPPAELALLSVFARRAIEGSAALPAPGKDVPDAAWARRYLAELRHIVGDAADIDATVRALRGGMDGDYFSQKLSKLRRTLSRQLGPAATPYLIEDGGARLRRYRLSLPASAVRFAALPVETGVV